MLFQLVEFEGQGTITTEINRDGHDLLLVYQLSNDIAPVCWPAGEDGKFSRKDSLWQSTCFELFIGQPGSRGYLEINLSPSGDWNCYQFQAYRDGMAESGVLELASLSSSPDQGLQARMTFREPVNHEMLLGPSVVIKPVSGNLRYFASGHADKPDFHDPRHYVKAGWYQL